MEEKELEEMSYEELMDETKKLTYALVKDVVSSAVGICGGLVLKSFIGNYIPRDVTKMGKIAYAAGSYGLYSLACVCVKKAIVYDIDSLKESWDAIVGAKKKLAEKNPKEYAEVNHGECTDAGQQHTSAE